MLKTSFWGAAAFVLGLTIATTSEVVPDREEMAAKQPPASGKRPAGSLCTGGPEGAMEVTIAAERTSSSPAGEVLEYTVRLRNRSDDPIRGRHAIELVTDLGSEIHSPEIADVVNIPVGSERAYERSTPAGLVDGFYSLRATAAVAAPSGDSTTLAQLYFAVQAGHIYPVDIDEFHARSRANEGVIR